MSVNVDDKTTISTPPKTPLEELGDFIQTERAGDVVRVAMMGGELECVVKAASIVPFLTFLRDDPRTSCRQLMDVCGVDQPGAGERFVVAYQLLSLRHNLRVRVKVTVALDAVVPSVTSVFPTAGWFEREAYDLMGIYFSGHPDLRRILTDYGFDGHPLRKDFPMTGFVELRYDDAQQRVVYSPVQLPQDYRNFDFLSPWEGMTDVQLPGDEKATKPKVGWVEAEREVS